VIVLVVTWGTGVVFTDRLPAELCYWKAVRSAKAKSRPREQHRDADSAQDAGGTNGKFKGAGRRPAVQKRG
jgi:hypothetical protein